MNYKQVCENHLSNLHKVITNLCDCRDKFSKSEVLDKFFQSQIDAIAILSNSLRGSLGEAEREELLKLRNENKQ